MKFGHRGANQPVRFKDGRIFITTQNHGFAVDADSLPEGCSVSYTNVNDGTLEGLKTMTSTSRQFSSTLKRTAGPGIRKRTFSMPCSGGSPDAKKGRY